MGHIVLRLDRVMADRKMSLNELSERVGVANVNLSKMKNGRISAIRFSTLAAISFTRGSIRASLSKVVRKYRRHSAAGLRMFWGLSLKSFPIFQVVSPSRGSEGRV